MSRRDCGKHLRFDDARVAGTGDELIERIALHVDRVRHHSPVDRVFERRRGILLPGAEEPKRLFCRKAALARDVFGVALRLNLASFRLAKTSPSIG